MGWVIQGLNLGRGKEFSLLQYISTSSEAHPTTYSMGTRVLAWEYSGKGMKVTTHLQLALILRMIFRAIPLFLLNAFIVWPVEVTTFFIWQKKSMKLMNSKVYPFVTHEVFRLSDKVLWKTFFFIVAPCIFILSESFIYQQMHFISVLENIKIYIKTAPTCFSLRPSSGSLHMSLAKVTFIILVKVHRYGLLPI